MHSSKTISIDLRQRILDASLDGETTSELAERFAVSASFVRGLMRRYRQTGSIAAKQRGGYKKPALADREAELRLAVEQNPSATLAERNRDLKLGVDDSTLWRTLRRLGLTYKKSRSRRPSKSVPT